MALTAIEKKILKQAQELINKTKPELASNEKLATDLQNLQFEQSDAKISNKIAADEARAAAAVSGKADETFTATDGTTFTNATAYGAYQNYLGKKLEVEETNKQSAAQAEIDKAAGKVSAFNILRDELTPLGLGSLVEGIRGLLTDGTPAAEFSLKLRETPQYKARFSANEARIKAGLAALSPAEYVATEDQYQNIMRNYGLPKSYYDQSIDPATGVKLQTGFDKLLGADVSAVELEDRIATAQQRVLNSNPEVMKALRQFYPDISNADILAYTLDPQNGLENIKRRVTAAEIGGAALQQGLQALGGTAESLAAQGITKAQAQAGYANVAEMAPRGSALADIYGEGTYTQGTAEAEVFNTAGAADATRKRKKLTALETAQFSGSSGVGALGRDRATNYGTTQSGFGSY
jgi:hypothetical protein